MSKPGRNDPCPCGSGKKYKKCCELKQRSRGFEAKQISSPEALSGKMGSLFQSNVSEKPLPEKETVKEKKEPEGDKPL